jgi:hypothetical protein
LIAIAALPKVHPYSRSVISLAFTSGEFQSPSARDKDFGNRFRWCAPVDSQRPRYLCKLSSSGLDPSDVHPLLTSTNTYAILFTVRRTKTAASKITTLRLRPPDLDALNYTRSQRPELQHDADAFRRTLHRCPEGMTGTIFFHALDTRSRE